MGDGCPSHGLPWGPRSKMVTVKKVPFITNGKLPVKRGVLQTPAKGSQALATSCSQVDGPSVTVLCPGAGYAIDSSGTV